MVTAKLQKHNVQYFNIMLDAGGDYMYVPVKFGLRDCGLKTISFQIAVNCGILKRKRIKNNFKWALFKIRV